MKYFVWILLFWSSFCFGQVSPNNYGPSAFPIPDMLDGTIPKSSCYIAYDYFLGNLDDQTHSITSEINVQTSERVSFTISWDIMEFYSLSNKWLDDKQLFVPKIGKEFGDIYLSANFQLLTEETSGINLTTRATLKTASGGGSKSNRFYDSPGYYFDGSLSKNLKYITLAINGGFLCWQTDTHKQNDAFLYGLMLKKETNKYNIQFSWEGYVGWQNNGDSPNSFKLYIEDRFKYVSPFIYIQLGINDWPYQQVRVGLKFNLYGS